MLNKKWITCTPVAFRGDEQTFFSRDSGLCCRALQLMGSSAKVVMPEPAWDDAPDVYRVPFDRLRDPSFWREQNIDTVILYSWADPKYTSIAQAIHTSGLKLYLNMDTDGLISPFVEPANHIRLLWQVEKQKRGALSGSVVAILRLGWQCVGLHKHLSRLRHMNYADAVGVVSPIGAERIQKYARFFRRHDIAKKIHFISHPIDPTMCYSGSPKQAIVIAVGRWDDPVKRPDVLIAVASTVLTKNPNVRFVIIGKNSVRCAEQIITRQPEANGRIISYERLKHDQLCEQMNLAQISLCTSRSESFHSVSGEALLCGCSVVAPKSPYLPSLNYFIDGGKSGRLAESNPEALAVALLAELEAWEEGERDAVEIAQRWRERISSNAVAQQIDKLIS